MHARPLCLVILGFIAGILSAAGYKWLLLPALGIGIFTAGSIRFEKSKIFAWGKLIAYLISIGCGIYRWEAAQEWKALYEPMLYDGMKVTLQGELEEKEFKNKKYLYYLKNCYLKLETDSDTSSFTGSRIAACNRIIAEMETDEVSIGKVLVLEGSVAVFRQARNEGNFDEISFYQSQNIDFKLEKVQIKEQYGTENAFCEALYQLKQKLKAVYISCMSEDTSGVIARMVLGDKSLMDQDINQLYQKVGISHILAISGLHISVIGMTIYKLLRWIFGSYVISGIAAGGMMFAYGCMTGFRPSSTRAILMFFMMLAAGMLGRTYDSLSALSLSALCLLWENPKLLWYAGFLFSYGAVLGVVLVGNVVTKSFEEKKKVRDAIYSGFCIQLVTVPLTAYFYFEIPVYGMLVNLLVLPFMSVLLGFALAGGFAGLLWLPAAKWLLFPCRIILEFYKIFSSFMQGLPGASFITGQPQIWQMIAFYIGVAALVYLVWKRKVVRGFLFAGILLLSFVLYHPKSGMELHVLDVGQGDGIYLRTESGYDIFLDGGSSDVSSVGTYRILPFLKYKGVQKIDYWFISHVDKDHISGLQEILESGYLVEKLVFAENIVRDETLEALIGLAKAVGTEVFYMGYLDCLRLGNAKLTCVFPYEEFVTDDKNAASLVLYYEDADFSGLFTGDIGEEEERWLAKHCEKWLGSDSGIDVYKAAHHGSRFSNTEELLKKLKPEIAVISCGVNNSYGHPHAEAVERIKEAGGGIWSTAECGQVMIKIEADKIGMRGFVGEEK